MNCTQCGKPLTPLTCDACGTPLSTTTCEACGGPAPSCTVCGHAAQTVAPTTPPVENASAPPPTDQPTPPVQQASACPTQQPPAASYAQAPPPQPIYAPAPGAQPGGPVPPQMAAPSYPYSGPVPTKKVPIGGWLMLFLVFTCIGLAYQAFSLVLNLMASNINFLAIALSLIFSILPAVMILYYISQRDIKFKYWFYFSSVINFVVYALGIVVLLAMNAVVGPNGTDLIGDSLAASGLSGVSLPEGFLTIVVVLSVAVLVIAALVQVLWLVYFNKSRRVAYTFNPYNNPPQ